MIGAPLLKDRCHVRLVWAGGRDLNAEGVDPWSGAGPVESAAVAAKRLANWLTSREAPPLLTCPQASSAPRRKFRWRIADRAELIAARAARSRWPGAEPKPCRAAP